MHDLSLHLLDIVQNSIKAGARHIAVLIEADRPAGLLHISVKDDGCGMSPELLAQVTDPFVTTRTTRPVGLGLPLLKEQCELTGGQLKLQSKIGQGTALEATFGLDSIDRLPLGSLGDTWPALLLSAPDADFLLKLRSPGREAQLSTGELRQRLDGVPLTEPAVLDWIRGFVAEMQQEIFGGVLHEIIS